MRSREPARRGAHALIAALLLGVGAATGGEAWIDGGRWLFLGPLENSLGCDPGRAAASNWIAPLDLASLTPMAGQGAAIDFTRAASGGWRGAGDAPAWVCLGSLGLADGGLVDLESAVAALGQAAGLSLPTTDVVAVLVTYVTNRTPSPLPVRVSTASDDSIQVWVNDRKVQEVLACRGTASDWTEAAPTVLPPGPSTIKAVVWQGAESWSFRLGLRHLDGGPLSEEELDLGPGCLLPSTPGPEPLVVERVLDADPPSCPRLPDPGAGLAVTLRSPPGAGPPVSLTERIVNLAGRFAVGGIEAGGVYAEDAAPPGSPVGLFDASADIGMPCGEGSTTHDPSTDSYIVSGSGLDIWITGDQFHYAFKPVRGDFEMTARVIGREWAPDTRWGKAGIMARQSFSASARYSMIETHGEDLEDADRFAGRPTQGGSDDFEATPLWPWEHRGWLRLRRAGNVFTGYLSDDGAEWDEIGAQDWGPAAPSTVLVGLAVCSRDACRPASIVFDSVGIAGGDETPGPLFSDGGEIVWEDVPREALGEGIGYTLIGSGRVAFAGHDGKHAIEGPGEASLHTGVRGAGIFTAAHDIGSPCFPGSTSPGADPDAYRLEAGGDDVWTGGDQFHFAWSRIEGDFSLRARIADASWAARHGKGGLMARESCERDARYSFIHDSPDPDGACFAIRRSPGASADEEMGQGGHPAWLRLDRAGSTFTAWSSDDGEAWTLRAREEWTGPVPSSLLAGLALTSHAGCAPASMGFAGVSLGATGASLVREIGRGGAAAACPPPDDDGLPVRISGSAPGDGEVPVVEEIQGNVEVSGITGGGVFEPFALRPIGIFTDARDVGGPCVPGSTVSAGAGAYRITASGDDIWTAGDRFHFAHLTATRDFTFTAHLAERAWVPGSRWGKAGVMARAGLDPSSRYIAVQDHGEALDDPTRWAARPTEGGTDNYEATVLGPWEHHDWLRIQRAGRTFIGWSSADGSTWVEQGRQTWADSPQTVLVGLQLASHVACSPASVVFDRVEFRGIRAAAAPPPGGTIAWKVPAEALEEGISYRLEAAGGGMVRLRGTAGGADIAGDAAAAAPEVRRLDGRLVLAHDIGGPCAAGRTVLDPASGSYHVTGSGADIWQGGDQFQFAYRRIDGPFFIAVARTPERRWAAGSRWGKAGIMAREDCSPRARYAMIQDHGEDLEDQPRLAFRPTSGGDDNREVWSLPSGSHRDWLRLERRGTLFIGSTSSDGSTWERAGSVDLGPDAPPAMLLGLAVNSHAGCAPSTVVFDGLRIQTAPNRPPDPCIVTDPAPPEVLLAGGSARITLDARCSGDGDGGDQPLGFAWKQIGGPPWALLEGKDSATATATLASPGTYLFQVTVDDGQIDEGSASASVQVTAIEAPRPVFRRGDANGNGKVDIADAIFILSYLFTGSTQPACPDAADMNDSGKVDLSDAVYGLNWLFLGAKVPPPPGPFYCGEDPSDPSGAGGACVYPVCD